MNNKINRRELLALMGTTALGVMAGGGTSIAATSYHPTRKRDSLPCRPTISGPLWFLDPANSLTWSIDRWRDELDEQHRVGFDLLWLCNTAGMLEQPGDLLGDLLELCGKRKVQVILDTRSGGHPWWDNLERELEVCGKHIRTIGERYGGHPAFYAWYIPHEIYMCWDEFDDMINELYPGLTKMCKESVEVPVTVSPFFILDKDQVFGGFRYNEPDEYRRYWTKLIKRSGIDIIMLQDSGEHFSFTTIEQRRPFFEAMNKACDASGAKLWGNVETAEYDWPSMEEYIRVYGRVHHGEAKGIPWRAVPIDRLKAKLELAAHYSERIVCWGYREYGRPALGPQAAKWHEDYKGYYSTARQRT